MTELETLACITRVVLTSDERAFEKIVRAYEQPLRLYLLQQTGGDEMLTDDLAQETFIKVWQQLNTFRHASQFKTWLFSIAYHLFLDDCRKKQNLVEVDEALLLVDQDDGEEAENRAQWVDKALQQIPEPARSCITLFYMQDMTAAEVAKITGLQEKNVRQILFRYKPKLKTLLEETRYD